MGDEDDAGWQPPPPPAHYYRGSDDQSDEDERVYARNDAPSPRTIAGPLKSAGASVNALSRRGDGDQKRSLLKGVDAGAESPAGGRSPRTARNSNNGATSSSARPRSAKSAAVSSPQGASPKPPSHGRSPAAAPRVPSAKKERTASVLGAAGASASPDISSGNSTVPAGLLSVEANAAAVARPKPHIGFAEGVVGGEDWDGEVSRDRQLQESLMEFSEYVPQRGHTVMASFCLQSAREIAQQQQLQLQLQAQSLSLSQPQASAQQATGASVGNASSASNAAQQQQEKDKSAGGASATAPSSSSSNALSSASGQPATPSTSQSNPTQAWGVQGTFVPGFTWPPNQRDPCDLFSELGSSSTADMSTSWVPLGASADVVAAERAQGRAAGSSSTSASASASAVNGERKGNAARAKGADSGGSAKPYIFRHMSHSHGHIEQYRAMHTCVSRVLSARRVNASGRAARERDREVEFAHAVRLAFRENQMQLLHEQQAAQQAALLEASYTSPYAAQQPALSSAPRRASVSEYQTYYSPRGAYMMGAVGPSPVVQGGRPPNGRSPVVEGSGLPLSVQRLLESVAYPLPPGNSSNNGMDDGMGGGQTPRGRSSSDTAAMERTARLREAQSAAALSSPDALRRTSADTGAARYASQPQLQGSPNRDRRGSAILAAVSQAPPPYVQYGAAAVPFARNGPPVAAPDPSEYVVQFRNKLWDIQQRRSKKFESLKDVLRLE